MTPQNIIDTLDVRARNARVLYDEALEQLSEVGLKSRLDTLLLRDAEAKVYADVHQMARRFAERYPDATELADTLLDMVLSRLESADSHNSTTASWHLMQQFEQVARIDAVALLRQIANGEYK